MLQWFLMGDTLLLNLSLSLFFLKFIWLPWVLWHVGSGSLTRDWTQAQCIGSRVLTTGPPGKSSACLFAAPPAYWELFHKNLEAVLCLENTWCS